MALGGDGRSDALPEAAQKIVAPRPRAQQLIPLSQPEHVNPGIRSRTLERRAKIRQRRQRRTQTVGIGVRFPFGDRDVVTIDVARRHASEVARGVGNSAVVLEQIDDIRDSRLDIMNMVRAGNSLRSLPQLALYQV
jgi:hypothetical protein